MLSRREWIGRLLALAGLSGFAGRSGAAGSPTKVTQAAAQYRGSPHEGQMCSMCRFYIPPVGRAGSGMMGGPMGPGITMAAGTCKVVEGRISPMGWCVLYRPLSERG